MAKDSAFLKKVYDKYLDEDFAYGVSNLNPKREISKGNLDDAKTIEQQVIEEIEKQFAEIKKETSKFVTYKKAVEEVGDDFKTESGGMGGSGGPTEMSGEEQFFQSLGGTDELFFIPGIENEEETPLEREIKQYILKLTPYLGIGVASSTTSSGTGTGDASSDDNLAGTLDGAGVLQMNCNGLTFKELLKKKKTEKGEDDSEDDENPAHGEEGHVCDETCPNYVADVDKEEEETDTSGDSGSTDDGGAAGNAEENDAAVDEDQALLLECALQQCAILQVILIMVRVMSTLKKALAMVLSIVVPIVKIVARAASCWVDPPAAAEAAQLVAEKVAAIIIGLIAKLLQMIWDSLKLDCVTSVAQDILNQINQILAGIDSLTSIGKQMSMMASGALKEMDNALDAIKAAKEKQVALDDLKKELGNSMTAAKDAFTKSFDNENGALLNQILPPGCKELVSATKAIQMSMTQLGKTAGEVKALSAISKGFGETKAK